MFAAIKLIKYDIMRAIILAVFCSLILLVAYFYLFVIDDALETNDVNLIGSRPFIQDEQHCIPKSFHSDDSFVCVCNATYCDTITRPSKAPLGHVLVYTTSKKTDRFKKELHRFTDLNSSQTCSATVFESTEEEDILVQLCLNSSDARQEIVGFGGSFTDSTGINLKNLSSDVRTQLLNAYFSTSGLEYNLGRVPIGGTDFSPRPYSYNDDAVGDLAMHNFTLQMEDYEYKIPFIQEASRISTIQLKLIATTWSPPAWMKINNRLDGLGWLKGTTGGPYYDSYANYHIKFFEQYEQNGIVFWALTPVNEPVSGLIPFYNFNCLGFTPHMMTMFVNNNLGPALKASRYNTTKILIYDLGRMFLTLYVDNVMSDKNAEKYVDGIALHWYHDTFISPDGIEHVHRNYPDKFLLMTEASITHLISKGPSVILGSWQRAEIYCFYMIQNLQHWVTGWIDWNMALDLDGGPAWDHSYLDSPIIVNATGDEFYKQPMFYVLGHFSKFVLPGSYAIDLKQGGDDDDNNVMAVAFLRPDSAIVLVVLNRNNDSIRMKITDTNFGSLLANIPGKSLQTYIWWKN